MIFFISDSILEPAAPSTGAASDTPAAATAAEKAVVLGFVPVSLLSVLAVDEVAEVVEEIKGDESVIVVVAVVLAVVAAEIVAVVGAGASVLAVVTVVASSVAADAEADGGAARLSLVTTLEYCCISITAASNNT